MTELRARERSLLATGFALLMIASPLRVLWAHPSGSWLTPFFVWGTIAALAAWVVRAERAPR